MTIATMLLPFLIACGDKDAAVDDTSATTDDTEVTDTEDTSTDEVDCGTDAYADATDKNAWMTACMSPPMEATFTGHDSERYGDFSCGTCHAGASTGDFTMPSQWPLDWTASDTWEAGYYNGDGTGFMELVRDETAGILGQEVDSTGSGDGFNCNSCHKPG